MSERERTLILEAAHAHGVKEARRRHAKLNEWLAAIPPEQTWKRALQVIRDLMVFQSTDARQAVTGRLMEACERIAAARAASSDSVQDLGRGSRRHEAGGLGDRAGARRGCQDGPRLHEGLNEPSKYLWHAVVVEGTPTQLSFWSVRNREPRERYPKTGYPAWSLRPPYPHR